ncbi:MAG TPA: type I-E CRISPR-associated endonuclease Cas1e [Candidatus Hydrogenedentes bacterium]|nr:type I-E CRISPR-associated endonuclease Cas1e [Candidatus Hydrogenedentota bacterium]HPG65206.1 type I-E CRISPR-associated endonuclease Cas1e [Candidatus Hydrogenedentota bacterium]
MRTKDLHELPKVRDKWGYLYVEHCRIDQEAKAIAIHDVSGVTPVPCAALALLMLGPGTNITHAAVLALADNGCLIAWCGEHGVRFYASGTGTTRDASGLLTQAALCSDPDARLRVVRKLYEMRFPHKLDPGLTLEQIRGREGVRVRDAYARASRESGVAWEGRSYDRTDWKSSDPVNRALSTANACLYGICHSAIVAAGYSPALGFIHTGKQLSFVYDVADLYKCDMTVPLAFSLAAAKPGNLEREVRIRCRDVFAEQRLLSRIVDDIKRVLDLTPDEWADTDESADVDSDPAAPGALWDPERGSCPGGVQYGEEDEPDE